MNIRKSFTKLVTPAVSARKFFVFLLIVTTVLLAAPSIGQVSADMTAVAPEDPNIQYVGRWDQSAPDTYRGYWAGTSFTAGFTGTSVRLKLGSAPAPAGSDLYASIDGGPYRLYKNASGIVNLTRRPLEEGTHTVSVVTRNILDVISFQGLLLDEGAQTAEAPKRQRWIEFVGDSITVGYKTPGVSMDSYAWLTAERLNADHTQIAYTGICLTNGVSCNGHPPLGMSGQYFKLQPIDYANSPDWDFAGRQPDAVVVNLGTNDERAGVEPETFRREYAEFLRRLRDVHPGSELVVIRPLNGYMADAAALAVQDRAGEGETRLHLVETAGWLSADAGDFNDALHPSVQGNAKMADRLAPALQDVLGW
ncbi:GDSL-type esterase/lipase family protein [Saccharibacillus sp. CPCC 101409]|uniref:SGNH/GDSL hydrolase family protein n=1 Tax=Saccharibacillus sp. CPCC 101409 TaxID=3058041 RepID=UPI00267233B4|nr:SGNH/GDSL hydrolase family protein [Saccharibacillus sp. CPCC 101409]MDO3413348.1 GDSL-type esterase/lipase family protein [Saccharibacillus sp. CPCC 101409]